jgi:hypothetical protein
VGEVDGIMLGISSMSSSKPEWLEPDPPVNFLVQFGYGGEGRHPTFPNVPRIDEFAKTADDKAIFDLLQLPFKVSRPFAGPSDMPADSRGFCATRSCALMRTRNISRMPRKWVSM